MASTGECKTPFPAANALVALLFGYIPGFSESYRAIEASIYDHPYGAFGGEFDNTNVKGCNPNVKEIFPGMVRDRLGRDPLLGKKLPLRGDGQLCSENLEKWFDPRFAVRNACTLLFLENAGTDAIPIWRFDSEEFFPADSLGYPGSLHHTGPGSEPHDFSYCMEINASFTYRGGEYMRFRADDDLWVFLDGRLVMDQGGIHLAFEQKLHVDRLEFLQGRIGESVDLDVYFCGRIPATTVFGMETSLDLKPAEIKELRIADETGRILRPNDVIIGQTRLCARPFFRLPGEEACANYEIPPDFSLLDAQWDLEDRVLSGPGGQQCIDLDPEDFPHGARMTVTAKAQNKTSRVALSLLRGARPRTGILHGRGRLESVEILLGPDSGPADGGLGLEFHFAGRPRRVQALPEGEPGRLLATLGESQLGPHGVSAAEPVAAITREVLGGHELIREVVLVDGIRPVALEARLHWNAGAGAPAHLLFTASEPLDRKASLSAAIVTLKRPGGGLYGFSGTGAWLECPEENACRLHLSAEAAVLVNPGDSLALAETAMDLAGNPAHPRFVAVGYPAPETGHLGGYFMQENPATGADFTPRPVAKPIVLVDGQGRPLLEDAENLAKAQAQGPILVLATRYPLERLELSYFDHHGAFVNGVEHAFSEEEWRAALRHSPGDTARIRVMWYPVSGQGRKAATGAYIVKGRALTRGGIVPVAGGGIVPVKGTVHPIGPLLFGYIRR